MLARRPMHFHSSGRRDVHADFLRIIHPDFVFDNLSLESGVAKFLRDIIGGRFVLGRARHMGRLRQHTQMLFRQLGVRHSKKASLGTVFGSRVAKAEDGLGRSRRSAADCYWKT